jgi:hypothetical protein
MWSPAHVVSSVPTVFIHVVPCSCGSLSAHDIHPCGLVVRKHRVLHHNICVTYFIVQRFLPS